MVILLGRSGMKAFGLSAALAAMGLGICGGEAIAHKVRHAHNHDALVVQNEPAIVEEAVAEQEESDEHVYQLNPGSNEMLRAPISLADDLEVIISDVIIPPNTQVPRHFHPGEEFIYLIEGSVVNVVEGLPDRIMRAGETFVMPSGVAHAPYTTDEGARAIVFRVHVEGRPERYLVESEEWTIARFEFWSIKIVLVAIILAIAHASFSGQ